MLLVDLGHFEHRFTNFSNFSTLFDFEGFFRFKNYFEIYKRYFFQNELPMEYGGRNLSDNGVLM